MGSRERPKSQHRAHADTEGNPQVLLFVYQHHQLPNGLAEPLVFLGPAVLRTWKGARPMQIEWDLVHAMPGWLYREAAVLER